MARTRLSLMLLAVLALLPVGAQAQGGGTITGRVVDATTQRPLPGAQVFVVGTTRGALTNAQGMFLMPAVPAGTQTVRASLIGYSQADQQVTVAAGQTTTANFSLAPSAVELGAVVVTATGQTQTQREIGASVAAIDVQDVELAPITNTSQLLQGRAAGVVVLPSTGTSGTGSRIRIRGSNSISLSNEPLLVIDGVRVNNEPEAFSFGVGGQDVSRLNDLNPEDIENIQILKGPAASALYGTAAANGVIVVTTRKGRSGEARWRAWTEQGSIVEPNEYPNNVRGIGTVLVGRSAGATTTNCNIISQANGACRVDSLAVYNPLEQNSPFRDGYRRSYGISTTGGGEQATYYLSGEWEGEDGIYENNQVRRINLRANLTGQLAENLTAQVSTGYFTGTYQLPYNDNAVEGFIGAGLLGTPTAANVAANGGYYAYPKDLRYAFELEQDPSRFLGSLNLNFQPTSWLSLIGTTGMDVNNAQDVFTILPGLFTPSQDSDYAEGMRQINAVRTRNYNATLSANTNYTIAPEWVGSTSLGTQYTQETYTRADAFGQGLLAGTKSLNAASKLFEIDEVNEDIVTVGTFAQQQLTWRDRVYLTGAIRGDDNSAFGQDFDIVWYPSVSLSWVIDEEAFWRPNAIVNTLRLRSAWGQSGLQPEFRAATTYFEPVSVVLAGAESPAFTVGGTGNTELKPERSTEYEFGFDAGLFGQRVGLEFTYYNKTSTDALVRRVLAPSLGTGPSATGQPAATRWENIGEVRNAGFEALVNFEAINRDPLRLDFTFTGATNSNELVELGEGIEPIIFGLGGNTQRHAEGFPLGAYFDLPIESYADENGDGIIAPGEIEVGEEPVFLGRPFPKYELALNTNLSLFSWLKLSALVDHKGGHQLYNATTEFRCSVLYVCNEIQDASVAQDLQARAVAMAAHGTVAGYIEDADFTKLREVSLTLSAPQPFAQRFGMDALSLTLSGRNLGVWTDYSGLDPELNYAGQSNFNSAEFLTQPPVRYFIARVDVGF